MHTYKNIQEIHLPDDLRLRAMHWLLVLDHVKEEVAAGRQELSSIPQDPSAIVQRIGDMAPHKICQFAFKRNDIVWICKNCQKDDTCVLCNECFRYSQHEGHEVYFYHTQAGGGGCCDCGDEDAWDKAGFCHRHGQDGDDPLGRLPRTFIASGRWLLQQTAAFLLEAVTAVLQSFDLDYVQHTPWGGSSQYYLLLQNDDVHTQREVTDILAQIGHFPPQLAGLYANVVHENGEARLQIGKLEDVRKVAKELRNHSLLVSLLTRRLHRILKVALLQVQWLHGLAGVSGGICHLVVEQLSGPVLSRLMQTHGHLPKKLASALQTLYLFLMADQSFKNAVAHSYAQTYLDVSQNYGNGIGVAEYSLYSISVQFLNRPVFVNELVGYVQNV